MLEDDELGAQGSEQPAGVDVASPGADDGGSAPQKQAATAEPEKEAVTAEPEPEKPKAAPVVSEPDGLDVTKIASDTETAEPEATPEEAAPEEEPTDDTFKFLDMELDDLDEFKHDGFYENLEPKHIERMDQYSKRMLHNVRIEMARLRGSIEKKRQKLENEFGEREAELARRERRLLADQEKLMSWTQSDDFKKAIETKSEDQLPPADTPEGILERAKAAVRQEMAQAFKPMQQSYDDASRKSRYLEYISERPEFKDQKFKEEVAEIIEARRNAGQQISLDDAYNLARGKRLLKKEQQREANLLRAQQESASKIQSRVVSGQKEKPAEVPENIRKQGALAVYQYLEKNADIAAKVRSKHR